MAEFPQWEVYNRTFRGTRALMVSETICRATKSRVLIASVCLTYISVAINLIITADVFYSIVNKTTRGKGTNFYAFVCLKGINETNLRSTESCTAIKIAFNYKTEIS